MPITKTKSNKEMLTYLTGFPKKLNNNISIDEFNKLSLKEQANFLSMSVGKGPKMTMEEIVKECRDCRNEK